MSQLRIGDAERERAAADLGEHYAEGRLTADEHAERLDQVLRARTDAELAPVFSDLPGGTYGARPAPMPPYAGASTGERAWRPGRSRRIPAPLFVLLAIVVAVVVLANLPLVLGGLFVWVVFFKHRRWHHGR